MNMDILTLAAGIGSFVIFLLVHVITFRRLRPEQLLKSLFAIFIAIEVVPMMLMGIFFGSKIIQASPQAWALATILAMAIEGLLCFFYVLCIFGPYETSVRMRLVREISGAGPAGLSEKELLKRYNSETIVNVRLRRLLGSGDIIEKDGFYRCKKDKNFFFIFDTIAAVLKKCIGC